MKSNRTSLTNQFKVIGFGTIITLLLVFFNAPIITRIVNPNRLFIMVMLYSQR